MTIQGMPLSTVGTLSQLPQGQNAGFNSRAGALSRLRLSGAIAYSDTKKLQSINMTDSEYADYVKDFDSVKDCKPDEQELFKLYRRKNNGEFMGDNKVLMELRPDQLNKEYLLSFYRKTGYLPAGLEADCMLENYSVCFRQEGTKIIFFIKNLNKRSNNKNTRETNARGDADDILGSVDIQARNTKTQNLLIDLKDIFFQDMFIKNTGIFKLPREKAGKIAVEIDKQQSCVFEKPANFKTSSEIGVSFGCASKGIASDNFKLSYNFSISELPAKGFKPRKAKNGICFETTFENSDKAEKEEYAQRWRLEKTDPAKEVSPPKKKIVYWISNKIPQEYRDSIKNGILCWNKAFRKIGFEDAIEVKVQPEDATWDSSYVEYNTINFINSEKAHASAPSQVDPNTGEIYAADVKISDKLIETERKKLDAHFKSKIKDDNERKKWVDKCVLDFITYISCHEVGHTFGFYHNFKASTVRDKDGKYISVMDYYPPDYENGPPYYPTDIGIYDELVAEYNYKPGEKEPDEVFTKMRELKIPYGNDYIVDTDPSCSKFDDRNTLDYCKILVSEAKNLWGRIKSDFAGSNSKSSYLGEIFLIGMNKYNEAINFACKYIGGLYRRKGNMEELGNNAAYEPVPPKEQREALEFLLKEMLSPAAFNFGPEVLRDFGINTKPMVAGFQKQALDGIFSAEALDRLWRFENNNSLEMKELFERVEKHIWPKLKDGSNINIKASEQELQALYIEKLISIIKYQKPEADSADMPMQAKILARRSLANIKSDITGILEKKSASMDDITKAYLESILEQIKI